MKKVTHLFKIEKSFRKAKEDAYKISTSWKISSVLWINSDGKKVHFYLKSLGEAYNKSAQQNKQHCYISLFIWKKLLVLQQMMSWLTCHHGC